MKKLILLIVIFLIAIIYSIMWFVFANSLEENLAKEVKRIPNAASEVAGVESDSQKSGVSVSGFPLDFNVSFDAGSYTIKGDRISEGDDGADGTEDNEGGEINISIDTPISYYVKVFEQQVRVILPKTIAIKYSIANKTEDILLSFEGDSAELSFYFNSRMIYHFKDLVLNDNLSYENLTDSAFIRDLRKFTYMDNGLLVYKGEKPKILYSHGKFITNIKKKEMQENYGSYSILLEYTNALLRNEYYREVVKSLPKGITKSELMVLKWVIDEAKRSGSSSGRLDVKYTGPLKPARGVKPSFDIMVNQIVYTDHLYSINTSGQITFNEEDVFPFGWVKFDIRNYRRLIDYYSRFYNSIIVPSSPKAGAVSLSRVNVSELEMYKKLVPRVGKVSSDENDILISISRPKGASDVFVGNTTLSRLKNQLRKEYKRYKKQLEKSKEE